MEIIMFQWLYFEYVFILQSNIEMKQEAEKKDIWSHSRDTWSHRYSCSVFLDPRKGYLYA